MKQDTKHSQHTAPALATLAALVPAAFALAALLSGGGCTMPDVYHTSQRPGAGQVQTQARPQARPQPQAQPGPVVSEPETVATIPSAEPESPTAEPSTVSSPAYPIVTPPPASTPVESPAPDAVAPLPASIAAPPAPASAPSPVSSYTAPPMPVSALATALAAAQQPAQPERPAAAAPKPAAPVVHGQPLVDTVWQLAALNASTQTPVPSTIMMLDTRKNELVGMSSDTRFKAQYTIDAGNLRFTQIATNRASSEITPFETALLNALSQTTDWRITDHTLTLLNQDKVLATLTVAGK